MSITETLDSLPNLKAKAYFIAEMQKLNCQVTQPKSTTQFTITFPDHRVCETVRNEIHGDVSGTYATKKSLYGRLITEALANTSHCYTTCTNRANSGT